jgi:hypothetical protein
VGKFDSFEIGCEGYRGGNIMNGGLGIRVFYLDIKERDTQYTQCNSMGF